MSDVSFLTVFISPLLVLIGWKVVYFNARRIATRSESKSIVDNISKIINEIADASVNFWEPKSSSNEYQKFILGVSSKSSQLQHFVMVLLNRGVKLDLGLLSTISDSATLGAEDAKTMSEEAKTLKAHEAVESCMQGLQHIFTQFEVAYPPEKELIMYEFFHWSNDLTPHQESKSSTTL